MINVEIVVRVEKYDTPRCSGVEECVVGLVFRLPSASKHQELVNTLETLALYWKTDSDFAEGWSGAEMTVIGTEKRIICLRFRHVSSQETVVKLTRFLENVLSSWGFISDNFPSRRNTKGLVSRWVLRQGE